jgi:ATP-dependent Lon protease
MSRPVPGPSRDASQGYSLLLCVDSTTGRFNGSETILVPRVLAENLNAGRLVLYEKRTRAEAWVRAGVCRTPPASLENDELPEPEDSVAQLRAVRETMQPRPTVAPPPVGPVAPPEVRKCRASRGQAVHVISAATITERRKSVDLRIRFNAEEKKTEIKAMDDLLARGETRPVGLSKDWRHRIARLRSDMPHLAKVIDRIEACCALSAFTRQPLRIPPLLLAGPPGVGKTHFAMAVADLLGVAHFVYAMESAETVSVLTGSEKHWSNAEAGQLFRLIVQGDHANPLILLDELDKTSTGGNHYRPANALHAVLEPLTAKSLRDKCIDLTFDASYTVYIATANKLSTIDSSLLSRFELFHVQAPDSRAAVSMARAMGRQVLHELKLTRRFDTPTGEVVQQLALLGSPRQMKKVLIAAIGRAVVGGRKRLAVSDLMSSPEPHPFEGGRNDTAH